MSTLDSSQEGQTDDAAILVVDDLQSSRMMLGAILSNAGFTNVSFAEDGLDGFEKLKAGDYDIVVLDIVMPKMDGFEMCRKAREELDLEIPVLVQTSLSKPEQKMRAFDVGASDIVIKPVDAGELLSRVRLHLDRRRLVQRLQTYQTRMQAELKTAEEMQLSLLKSDETVARIAERYGVGLETLYLPSNQLGGDFFDLFEIDDDRLGVLSVDLTGHGVSAAINAFRLHILLTQLDEHWGDPGQFVSALNEKLCDILSVEHFATVFYAVFHKSERRLTYASGGAPAPIWLRAGGDDEAIEDGGMLVGCLRQAPYETYALRLDDAGHLFCYSDALYERFDDPEASLDTDELKALVRSAQSRFKPGTRLEEIRKENFPGGEADIPDDLTMIWLEWS